MDSIGIQDSDLSRDCGIGMTGATRRGQERKVEARQSRNSRFKIPDSRRSNWSYSWIGNLWGSEGGGTAAIKDSRFKRK